MSKAPSALDLARPRRIRITRATYLIGKIAGVYGFYRSDDLGRSWIRINDDQHQFGGVTCISGDPRIYGRVYVGSSNRGVLYADPAK